MTAWLAIVNPHSGGARTRALLPSIVDRLRLLMDKTVFTEYPGHARELAMSAAAYSGVAIVGGDGTVFEILQGLDRARQRVAVIPSGRGNSLARDLAWFRTLASIDTLRSSEPSLIDLMEVLFDTSSGPRQQRVSASTVALGYPTIVAQRANRGFRPLGKYCYAAAAASTCPAPFQAQVARDGGAAATSRLTGFMANNTRHVANFVAFPDASMEDGLFDVMEVGSGFFRQSVHNVSALSGLQFYNPVTPAKVRSAQVLLDRPQDLLIDGEIYPDVIAVEIRILASALACNRGVRKA